MRFVAQPPARAIHSPCINVDTANVVVLVRYGRMQYNFLRLDGESERERPPCRFEQRHDFAICQIFHLLGRGALLNGNEPQTRQEARVVCMCTIGLDAFQVDSLLTLRYTDGGSKRIHNHRQQLDTKEVSKCDVTEQAR